MDLFITEREHNDNLYSKTKEQFRDIYFHYIRSISAWLLLLMSPCSSWFR